MAISIRREVVILKLLSWYKQEESENCIFIRNLRDPLILQT